jgi:hypothetical protein
MTTKQTADQLRLAAEIFETGHPFEYSTNIGVWIKAQSGLLVQKDPIQFIVAGHKIRPILATPPYPAELHNPDNLTAEQVGVGWRLLLKGESNGGLPPSHSGSRKCEGWEGFWNKKMDNGSNVRSTYRLPLTTPWPEPAKDEPAWIPWDGGECPLKDDEVEEWEVKVPLGPEDVTPFTRFRVKLETKADRFTLWVVPLSINQDGIVIAGRTNIQEHSWLSVNEHWEQNNSLETGKWNPDAWEACEK